MPAAQQMEVSSSCQGTSQGAWTQAGRRLPWQAQFSLWIFSGAQKRVAEQMQAGEKPEAWAWVWGLPEGGWRAGGRQA